MQEASFAKTTHNGQIQPEPVRDWSLGFLSGHRFRVAAYLIIGILVLYDLQSFLWPVTVMPHTLVDSFWSWGSLLWLGAVIPGSMGLAGMLLFRHPDNLYDVRPMQRLVSWLIVSSKCKCSTICLASIASCNSLLLSCLHFSTGVTMGIHFHI